MAGRIHDDDKQRIVDRVELFETFCYVLCLLVLLLYEALMAVILITKKVF